MSKRTKINGVNGNNGNEPTTLNEKEVTTMSNEIETQDMNEVIITLTRKELLVPATFKVSSDENARANGETYTLRDTIDFTGLTGEQILAGLTSSLIIKLQNKLRGHLSKGMEPTAAIEIYKQGGFVDPSTITNFKRLAEEARQRNEEKERRTIQCADTQRLINELLARGIAISDEQRKILHGE